MHIYEINVSLGFRYEDGLSLTSMLEEFVIFAK